MPMHCKLGYQFCVVYNACLFLTTDLCTAPPDESACRGTHGTEHGAHTRRTAGIGQATAASKPLANDQSRHGTDTQPGLVASQPRTASWTWSHSSYCSAANEGTSRHTTAGWLLALFQYSNRKPKPWSFPETVEDRNLGFLAKI